MARYQLLQISGEQIVRMCETGQQSHLECVEGLPSGTKFIEARPAYDRHPGVLLLIEHESFDDVLSGSVIPIMPHPLFKTVEEK